MTIEKINNGTLKISDIVNNRLISKTYYYYTKKEAIKDFKEYIINKTRGA